jgi:hypothetical protein
MRRFVLLVVVALAIGSVGCSKGSGADNGQPVASSSSGGGAADGGGSGAGAIDCAKVKPALANLVLAIQILAQMRTPEQYDLVKKGTVTFDPKQTAADLEAIRPLEGVNLPTALGGPGAVKKSIDLYVQANDLATQNLAVDDPFTQAKGKELADLTKDTATFLRGQTAIAAALGEAKCA